MARNTSLGSYHFISRAGASNALGEGRELGASYKYSDDHFMAYQGVFTENQYNKEEAGFNGIVLAGRYQWRPINDGVQTLMVGGNIRYQHVGGGVVEKNVIKKTLSLLSWPVVGDLCRRGPAVCQLQSALGTECARRRC